MLPPGLRAPWRSLPGPWRPPSGSSRRAYFTSPHTRQNHRLAFDPQLHSRKLPLRTVVALVAVSSTTAMALYVGVEVWRFHRTNDTSRSLFLPLWMNTNLLRNTTFKFPAGLAYLDAGFLQYMETEMNQLNRSPFSDIDNYCHRLQHENITYSVLEHLSANTRMRQEFGLPMVVEQPSDFDVWVEATNPSFSGIEINLARHAADSATTSITTTWRVKPFNVANIINGALVDAGLKLDRLDPPDLLGNDIHKSIPRFSHSDYDVVFSGQLAVMDKSRLKRGIVRYRAKLDFDHLVINRGVKMTDISLVHDSVVYKVL